MCKKLFFFVIVTFVVIGTSFAQTHVTPGDRTLGAAIAAAAPGDVLELENGGLYTESVDTTYRITFPLTIKAATGAAEKPKIQNLSATISSGSDSPDFFLLYNGASLTLQGLEFDGDPDTTTYNSANNLINFPIISNMVIGTIKILDCYFHNAGGKIFDGDNSAFEDIVAPKIDSLIIENSLFKSVEAIYTRTVRSVVSNLIIENCTFWNFDGKALYLRDNNGQIFINHCTFNNVGNLLGSEDEVIRIRGKVWVSVVVKNCIFSFGSTDACLRIDDNPTNTVVSNLCIYDIGNINLGSLTATNIIFENPKYTDAANGDFTLSNDSPCLGAADDGKVIGDTRWDPSAVAVELKNISTVPEGFALRQNYPNPFNPATTIDFSIDQKSHVSLYVYDITGSLIETLIDKELGIGSYSVTWDASEISSGLYFYQLISQGKFETKKMTLMK